MTDTMTLAALADLLPPWITSDDSRATARALPGTPAAAEAVHAVLSSDLAPIFYTLDNPSSRDFRLALSALVATIDVSFSALLADQRVTVDFVTRQSWTLHLYVVAWHFCVLHPPLMHEVWGWSGDRPNTLIASVSGLLSTLTPCATIIDTRLTLDPPADLSEPCPVRTAVFTRRVQLAMPHHQAVHQFLAGINMARFSSNECSVYFTDTPHQPTSESSTWLVIPRHQLDHELKIHLCKGHVVRLECSASLAPLRLPSTRGTRFLPAQLNWIQNLEPADTGRIPQREASPPLWFKSRLSPSPPRSSPRVVLRSIPSFHVTTVIAKRGVWHKRFKRFLGQAARVILDGRLCLPLDHHEGPPLDAPNLPTCFSHPEHTRFVDGIVSEYLVTGVCSWYPATSKPIAICPLSVVPKKTEPFFRLVIDARGPNLRMSRWASNMKSLASSAHIFEPGSVVWTRDIGKAYIVSAFQGCRQAFTPRVRADGFKYDHVGCEPDNCTLSCSKCLLGFRWRSQHFVFNAPMFGGKVSGNILDTLFAPIDRWIRAKGISLLRWVDDLALSLPPRPELRHDTVHCGGTQSCMLCQDTLCRATRLMHEFDALLTELGFTLNDKRTLPSQRGEFIGLGWDTIRCCFWMPAAKANALAETALNMALASSASRRQLAQFRGKLTWFSPCLSGVRLLLRTINTFIGNPESDSEWDAVVILPADVISDLQHWARTLPTSADHERPLWSLRPAQVLEMYRMGNPVVTIYMETDASIYGWGCFIRINMDGVWSERRTSVPWSVDQPLLQVQCEGEALHQALLTFLTAVSGRAVLHITDCRPTLGLPERGSATSAQLQRTARSIWLLCSVHGIFLYSAWVPGLELVQSGTDNLSRDALRDPHCASLRPDGWSLVLKLAHAHHRPPVIDWFADLLNCQLPSYWSRYLTPTSSGEDALAAPSWDHSRCEHCSGITTTFGYFFPPVPLLDRVFAKAKLDLASGIAVIPRLVGAVWWPILASAAISEFIQLPPRYINFDREHCDSQLRKLTWNIVVFDFARQPRLPCSTCQCPPPPDVDTRLLSSLARATQEYHARLARALLLS